MNSMFVPLLIMWLVLLIADQLLKIYSSSYVKLLEQRNITLKPFYLKVCLAHFPRYLVRLPLKHKKFFRPWFNIGYVLTCMIVIPSAALLTFSAFRMCMTGGKEDVKQSQILQPVVPGYNIPFSQILYYVSALLLCTVVHEIGHAFSALVEGVDVEGYGMHLVAVVPAAYVSLPRDQLIGVSCTQRLRIFCAGVWHNIALAALAFLSLLLLPALASPCFVKGSGISVIGIDRDSGLFGPTGLSAGDVLNAVNDCGVESPEKWKACLKEISLSKQVGWCSSEQFMNKERLGSNVEDPHCCPDSLSHLCFRYSKVVAGTYSFSCLPVRKVLQGGNACWINSDCGEDICVAPHFDYNFTRLIAIKRQDKEDVIFLGSLSKLYNAVDVAAWTSVCPFIRVPVINAIETFLKYIISFSAALAVLNVIPCPGLDGMYIWENIAEWYFNGSQPETSIRKKYFMYAAKGIGISLISVNMCLGILKLM